MELSEAETPPPREPFVPQTPQGHVVGHALLITVLAGAAAFAAFIATIIFVLVTAEPVPSNSWAMFPTISTGAFYSIFITPVIAYLGAACWLAERKVPSGQRVGAVALAIIFGIVGLGATRVFG